MAMWELDPGSTLGVRVGIEVVSHISMVSKLLGVYYGYPHPVRMRFNPILILSAKLAMIWRQLLMF
jgi:hypothetical protein